MPRQNKKHKKETKRRRLDMMNTYEITINKLDLKIISPNRIDAVIKALSTCQLPPFKNGGL